VKPAWVTAALLLSTGLLAAEMARADATLKRNWSDEFALPKSDDRVDVRFALYHGARNGNH
jgi:hypothetical protein